MKISIVVGYYNRLRHLTNTLDTIALSKFKNIEFIIVDDGSDDEHRTEQLVDKYPFEIKIIRLEEIDRWYINPCVVFNKGFCEATGDIVLIQNPECLHIGDILSYIELNFNEKDYQIFGCYSINEETFNKINKYTINDNFFNLIKMYFINNNRSVGFDGDNGWYQHSIYRPVGLHFCSAISRNILINEIGGFNEEFANGIGYDDNELLDRIIKLKLNIKMIDSPHVIHQHHYSDNRLNKLKLDNHSLLAKNRELFNNYKNSNIIKVN